MRTVQLITDSTCAFPPDMDAALRATARVVRTSVQFGSESFPEGTLSLDDFYARIEQGRAMPQSSQPAPAEFLNAFRDAAPRGPILGLFLSGALSSTFSTGAALAPQVAEADIRLFDSHFFSSALGYMVAEAAAMAQAGATRDAILEQLEWRRARTSLFIAVDTLAFLRRSGRVNVFQAGMATVLDLKPILAVRDGKLVVVDRVRTRRRSLERLLALAGESAARHDGPVWVSAMHGRAPAEAQGLLDEMQRTLPVTRGFVSEVPASVALHGGPGVVGVMVTAGRR